MAGEEVVIDGKMTDAQINLAFLRPLGPNYETFL
jgi:hypothetical protein